MYIKKDLPLQHLTKIGSENLRNYGWLAGFIWCNAIIDLLVMVSHKVVCKWAMASVCVCVCVCVCVFT